MATIREYFDTDARALTLHGNWTFGTAAGVALAEVIAKVAYDFEANAKYWYFYVPAMADLSQCLGALFAYIFPETPPCASAFSVQTYST